MIMIVLVLAFVTLFLAIFSPCVAVLQKYQQTMEMKALTQRLQQQIEAQKHAKWRRNRQTILD